MATAEKVFEYLALAPETTRGTAVTPPTYYLGLDGMVKPRKTMWRPDEARGTLTEFYRSTAVRKWGEWEGEGGLDTYNAWIMGNLAVATGWNARVPSVPFAGVYLWSYFPGLTSDTLGTATFYWGDPNTQIFQGKFGVCEEFVITADASGTEGVKMSASGMTNFPAKVSAPALPAQLIGSLMAASDTRIWIDTSSDIGTNEITGRIIGAEVTIPTGVVYKYLGSTDLGYVRLGRQKRHITVKLMFELADMTQYDFWAASTALKARVRFNGPIIASTYKHYVQVDVYGPFDGNDWGLYESTNRTIELTIESEYNVAAGYDFAYYVQNASVTV